MHRIINNTVVTIKNSELTGPSIEQVTRKMKDLEGLFLDENAREMLDPEMVVYNVKCHFPVKEGTPGNLFFGTTMINPGKVGYEYYMTRGHVHEKSDRAEYYWGIQGEGMLLLMDRKGNTWGERMAPGSVHHIMAETAHRVANTGQEPLIFGACWPSDAGHDYSGISRKGFTARLLEVNGEPVLK